MVTVVLIAFGLPGTLYNWITWTHWWNETVWPLVSNALYASPKLLSPAMLIVGVALLLTDIAPHFRRARRAVPPPFLSPEHYLSALDDPLEPIPAAQRVFLDKTPTDLVNIYSGTTTTRADQVVAKYINHWMMIEGTVHDVDRRSVSCRTRDNPDGLLIAPVLLQFGAPWENRLSQFQRGQLIRAIGRLTEVTPIGISLDQCELLPSST